MSIIDRAKTLNRDKNGEEYYESHHIIPKCLGGKDQVLLTAKEHYICHLLLTKMMCDSKHKHKMIWALHRLSNDLVIRSRTYELVRKIHAKQMSEMYKGRMLSEKTKIKIGLSRTGKKVFRSKEHNEKIGNAQRGKPRDYAAGANNMMYKGTLLCLDKSGNVVKEYNGLKELQNDGFTKDAYYAASPKNKQKTHYSYYWKWKDP
jgi:hypothetical protein